MDETPHSDSGSAAPREEISRRLAHQLNNLLGGILGGADFLSRRSGSDPEVRHWASLIADAAGRASELLAPAPAISARPPEAAPPAAPGRVLLIEDDPSFAQVLSAMLGELGYEPECAATGADGLSRYIRAAGTIRLVVLDALLPDESGLRTLAALREADAGVRILLCTGLDDAALAGKDLGGCPVIKKPFRMADLARAVALALRPAPVAPPPPPLAEAARRALVVEDEPVMRNLLVRTLAETGWEVTAVCAGAEARPRFSDPFDLVLLDWNLPDASGLDLCREARAGEAGSIRHILMITAMSAAEDRERALGAGADDYLGKPFPLDLLRVRLAVAEKAIGDRRRRVMAEKGLRESNEKLEARVRARTVELELALADLRAELEARLAAEREARRQQEQVLQADKMATLGRMISGVAHEINNPVHYIMLNLPILRGALESALPILEAHWRTHPDFRLRGLPFEIARDRLPRLSDDILEGAERIKRIVAELKDFARPVPAQMQPRVDLRTVLASARVLLEPMLARLAPGFAVECAADLPPVTASPPRLEQVLVNLIQNGCEALRGPEGTLLVRLGRDPEGTRARIEVIDDGRGIEPENLARLTDPFFTTRQAEGGTGLGLAVCDRIVREHGGELLFASEPGRGTTVTVLLPAAAGSLP